jgi:hypothetical protein
VKDDISTAVQPNKTDHPAIALLKRNIASQLDARFPISDTITLCCLLDPGTKDTVLLSAEEKIAKLKDACLDTSVEESGIDARPESEPSHQSQAPMSKKRKLLASKSIQSAQSDLSNEISCYLSVQATPEEVDDPLLFWRNHSSDYGSLAVLAKSYLSISCSSVPVERMFTTTGIILNSKRSSLAPYKVNQLSFIHDNYSLFP